MDTFLHRHLIILINGVSFVFNFWILLKLFFEPEDKPFHKRSRPKRKSNCWWINFEKMVEICTILMVLSNKNNKISSFNFIFFSSEKWIIPLFFSSIYFSIEIQKWITIEQPVNFVKKFLELFKLFHFFYQFISVLKYFSNEIQKWITIEQPVNFVNFFLELFKLFHFFFFQLFRNS